jgi:tRNA-2-methylthio-N6-dimethylallyladenosine synthase
MNKEILNKIKERNAQKSRNPAACVVTFGCQQNEADSERIKGMLSEMGYEITDKDLTNPAGDLSFDSCDVVIVNTCAVREHAELKAFSRTGQLKYYKNKNKDMLVGMCGCMVEQEHILEYIKKSFKFVDFIFGTRSIHKFPEIFYEASVNRAKVLTNEILEKEIIDEELPVRRGSSFKAWVSVMYGCDNFCSYCVVPHVRGRERSRRKEKILEEVRGLVSSGYKDITLLGQNVNSYRDPENPSYRFTDLLSDIVKIDGDYWLRFITSHPKDIPDGLIKLMGENAKLANHIHLPLQSGSDRILKLMNRRYTRGNYLDLIAKLKKSVKDIAITTDIIVGFPGETDGEFSETLDMIEKAGFDNIFPFIYSKRKNTPADKMEDNVTHKEKTDRFAEMLKLQKEIAANKNKAYEGRVVRVLVESEYKSDKIKDGKTYIAGRTSTHKLVIFEGDTGLTGSFVNVKINEGRLHGLYGELEK